MLWPFIHISPFPMLIISTANGSFPSGASKVVCKNQPWNQLLYKNYHTFVSDSWRELGKKFSWLAGWFSPCTKSEASLWPVMILLSTSQSCFLWMKKHLKLHLLDLSAQNHAQKLDYMPASSIIPKMMSIKKLFLTVCWMTLCIAFILACIGYFKFYYWINHSKSHCIIMFSLRLRCDLTHLKPDELNYWLGLC
jgi:hypothetical protein